VILPTTRKIIIIIRRRKAHWISLLSCTQRHNFKHPPNKTHFFKRKEKEFNIGNTRTQDAI
jgi:hypothetical protein